MTTVACCSDTVSSSHSNLPPLCVSFLQCPVLFASLSFSLYELTFLLLTELCASRAYQQPAAACAMLTLGIQHMIDSRYHRTLQILPLQNDQSKIKFLQWLFTIALTTIGSTIYSVHSGWCILDAISRICHLQNNPKHVFIDPPSRRGAGDLINFVQNCAKLNCLWGTFRNYTYLKLLSLSEKK